MKTFFMPSAYDGCYYYRGKLPGIYTGNRILTSKIGTQEGQQQAYKLAMESDCIIIHRPVDVTRVELAKALKRKGKKIIFENDDTYLPNKGVPLNMLSAVGQEKAKEMHENLYEVLAMADGAIASTETLGNEYRDINPHVHVLKNCIEPLDALESKENTTGKFRVGFIGSVTSNDDYIHIKDQIRELVRPDITLVVFGIKHAHNLVHGPWKADYEFWNSLENVEWQPFVTMQDYYQTIANLSIDIAIIPRQQSYFNQCKSNLKFLEASLLEIPVIAQGFTDGTSPYQGADEKYMTVLTDNSLWLPTILDAKENYPHYKQLALKAKEYILENYNINTYAHNWQKAINTICTD
jgi:hypothetical protein